MHKTKDEEIRKGEGFLVKWRIMVKPFKTKTFEFKSIPLLGKCLPRAGFYHILWNYMG